MDSPRSLSSSPSHPDTGMRLLAVVLALATSLALYFLAKLSLMDAEAAHLQLVAGALSLIFIWGEWDGLKGLAIILRSRNHLRQLNSSEWFQHQKIPLSTKKASWAIMAARRM